MVGQTLGHYKILDKLGAGGMGEVYRAEDTTLKRQVALKVLPQDLAASQERLDRFQREAESLAALNHPNIVHVYTVEEDEGTHFLTMELVDGQPLSHLIKRGGLPLERIFETAIPLADALATAHEKGVIHRDLKPANIMVTEEGRVKVLDFGLAKLRLEAEVPLATELPTEPLTDEGKIVGTMPYMSPEQLEGKEIDARSDIFSLGVVLYEMAAGERPFQGETSVSLISSIVKDDPRPVDTVRETLPHHLARIIRRCLEKEPKRRYQSAIDVHNELEDLKAESASGEVWKQVAPPRRHLKLWAGLVAAGIVLVAALVVAFWALRPHRETVEDAPATRSATFTNLVFDTAMKGKVSASPDGRFFVYSSDASGNNDIYLQRIAGGNAINITGDCLADDHQPAFSPDGEWVAFRSEREGGGIFVMGATGETVRRITDHGYYPDWSPDGTKLVFSTSRSETLTRWSGDADQRIWIIDLSTGNVERVLDHSAMMPAWSPDGRWIAFYGVRESSETELETQYDLFTVPAEGGDPNAITEDEHFEHSPAWSPDSRSLHYVAQAGGSRDLWKVPIDEATGERLGNPERMTSSNSVAHISPSGDGNRVLYTTRDQFREILRVPFDPVAEKVAGAPASITPPGLQARHPAVSADGEWVAFSAEFGHHGSWAVGIVRRDGTELRQVTESGHRDQYPAWSPDGQRLVFQSNRSGSTQLWIVNADGGGLRQVSDLAEVDIFVPSWSPDGLHLAGCGHGTRGAYIFRTDISWSEEPPTQLPPVGAGYEDFCPTAWSMDAKFLAGSVRRGSKDGFEYQMAVYSIDNHTYRVLSEPLDGVKEDVEPQWLSDGRRLFFKSRGADGAYSILDPETGEQNEVMTSKDVAVGRSGQAFLATISPDNRDIYIHWYYAESAIWMLTLREQE